MLERSVELSTRQCTMIHKKRVIILLGIVLFVLLAVIIVEQGRETASLFSGAPEWIKGRLMITTIGSVGRCMAGDSPTLQSICIFDFDSRNTSSTLTGLDAAVIQDFMNGDMYVIERDHRGYSDLGDSSAYNIYGESFYVSRKLEYNSENKEFSVVSCFEEKGYSHIRGNDGHIKIVGDARYDDGMSWGEKQYYWRYTKDAEDEWEAELAFKDDGVVEPVEEPRTYTSVQLNKLQSTEVAISKNEHVAFTREYGHEIYCSDGYTTEKLSDEQCSTGAICWIDENTLLYTACVRELEAWGTPRGYALRLWHIDTGDFENYVINGNNPGDSMTVPPSAMCYDSENQVLAVYLAGEDDYADYGEQAEKGRVVFINMITGDQYVFVPWKRTLNTRGLSYANYEKDRSGKYFYDPGFFFRAKIFWYN